MSEKIVQNLHAGKSREVPGASQNVQRLHKIWTAQFSHNILRVGGGASEIASAQILRIFPTRLELLNKNQAAQANQLSMLGPTVARRIYIYIYMSVL